MKKFKITFHYTLSNKVRDTYIKKAERMETVKNWAEGVVKKVKAATNQRISYVIIELSDDNG